MTEQRLVIVSNRGPAAVRARRSDGERTVQPRRRRAGHRAHRASSRTAAALWIASAMTDEDVAVAREADGEPVEVELDGVSYDVLHGRVRPEAYDRFYNVIANPILWFIQHYLWDLSNAPDIRQEEADAWDAGLQGRQRATSPRRCCETIDDDDEPLVMFHDYHLYTAPAIVREARPGRVPPALRPHPLVAARQLADPARRTGARRSTAACSPTTSSASTPRAYCRNFLHCCRELMELEVDYERGAVLHDGRETWVRAYPLGIDAKRLERAAASDEVAEYERELLRRRRDHLIIRVDRADLSKNVLRGFTAFDTFLQQHPEFRERVTFIAHLQPSRQDVPEYAEYLERIEALVAVVNHRHGTTDWMPIDLRIYENFPEAVARYKHFDLLMVNSIFDGMNLVAKEAPAVNTRDGVVMLSENTGSHEELGDCTLTVNPFDIQEQADTIHRALTMDAEERAAARRPPARDRPRARPGRLDRRAARRHRAPSARPAQPASPPPTSSADPSRAAHLHLRPCASGRARTGSRRPAGRGRGSGSGCAPGGAQLVAGGEARRPRRRGRSGTPASGACRAAPGP